MNQARGEQNRLYWARVIRNFSDCGYGGPAPTWPQPNQVRFEIPFPGVSLTAYKIEKDRVGVFFRADGAEPKRAVLAAIEGGKIDLSELQGAVQTIDYANHLTCSRSVKLTELGGLHGEQTWLASALVDFLKVFSAIATTSSTKAAIVQRPIAKEIPKARAPGSLVFGNAGRPFRESGSEDLESLLSRSENDIATLRLLKEELECRSTKRARGLLERVTKLLEPATSPDFELGQGRHGTSQALASSARNGQECQQNEEISHSEVAALRETFEAPLEHSGDEANGTGISLRDLVQRSSTSMRLQNAARRHRLFEELSVRDMKLSNDQRMAQFLRLPAFGRTTWRELSRLVNCYSESVVDSDAPRQFVAPKLTLASSADEYRTLSIAQLISRSACSRRLTNRYDHRLFKAVHVEWVLENRSQFSEQVHQSVLGLGTRTVLELESLLDEVAAMLEAGEALDASTDSTQQDAAAKQNQQSIASSQVSFSKESSEKNSSADEQELRERLLAPFEGITLGDVLSVNPLSVRLMNVIRNFELAPKMLSSLIRDWDAEKAFILKAPNMGRTSFAEFEALVRGIVVDHLERNGMQRRDANDGWLTLTSNAPLPASHPLREIELSCLDKYSLQSTEIVSPDEILSEMMRELNDRERDVIERRFGFGGEGAETLEEVAADYDLTRERIRQIEKQALRRLGAVAGRFCVAESLVAFGEEAWRCLADNRPFVLDRELNPRRLSPTFRLLLQVMNRTTPEWLDEFANRQDKGWCQRSIDSARLADLIAEIERAPKRAIPFPLSSVGLGDDIEMLSAAFAVGRGNYIHDNYVFATKPTRRILNAVNLHQVLASDGPMTLSELAQIGISSGAGDKGYTLRGARAVLKCFPHLFIELADDVWAAVGGGVVHSKQRDRISSPVQPRVLNDAEGITGALERLLQQSGPSKLSQIMHRASAACTGFPATSVGPTLITQKDVFLRPLPGVYCLHGQLPSDDEIVANPPSYLCNDAQARFYAASRRAGEERGAYLLWTPAAEMMLCRWAQHHAARDVFQSLLAVACVDDWPVDADLRAQWEHRQQTEGRYKLAREPRPGSYAKPELERVLAACMQTAWAGRMNWVSANRIDRKWARTHASVGLMSILVSLSAIVCRATPPHWQEHHSPGPRLEEITKLLAGELQQTGVLSWESAVGQQVTESAIQGAESNASWIDLVQFNDMFEGLIAPQVDEPEADDEEIDDFDRLMAQHRRQQKDLDLQETMRWLMDSDEE